MTKKIKIRMLIQNIIDLHLDLIIFDENHFGGCSQLSKEIISTYSYKNTTLKSYNRLVYSQSPSNHKNLLYPLKFCI